MDHDYAVSTRGYQSDQPSILPLALSPARSPFAAWLNLRLVKVTPYQKDSFRPNCMILPPGYEISRLITPALPEKTLYPGR